MLPVRTDSILSRSPDRISRFLESHFPDFWNRLLLLNPHTFSSLNPFFSSRFTCSEQVIRNDVDGGDEVWRFFPDSWIRFSRFLESRIWLYQEPPTALGGGVPSD